MELFSEKKTIEGKGENAGSQHFLLFLQCLQKPVKNGLFKKGYLKGIENIVGKGEMLITRLPVFSPFSVFSFRISEA